MPYPYVLLSAAVSLDGYLDDTTSERLLLSSPADFDRVDEVRASVDAILIGAGTIRADNPRLLVNSPDRRAARVAAGRPEYPLKVTVSGSGDLDPQARFWHSGGEKVVYTTEAGAARARALGIAADVVLMHYEPTAPGTGTLPAAADRHWLALACELAAQCPPSDTAFSVGAVVVAADGTELARGHSLSLIHI